MGSEAGLQKTRNRGPDEAAEHAEGKRERDLNDPRQAVETVAGEDPEDGAEIELPLSPDVEEAGPEAKRDRQAQEDVGDHRHQRLGKSPRIRERTLK